MREMLKKKKHNRDFIHITVFLIFNEFSSVFMTFYFYRSNIFEYILIICLFFFMKNSHYIQKYDSESGSETDRERPGPNTSSSGGQPNLSSVIGFRITEVCV